jgi:hypothetical protein
MNDEKHTWYFPNAGLKALYDHEICGQLSDGAWENSTPYKHWYFWCKLNTEVGSDWNFKFNNAVDYDDLRPVKRSGYNLLTLVDSEVVDLSYRMRAYYVDGILGTNLGRDAENLIDGDRAGGIDQLRVYANNSNGKYWQNIIDKIEALSLEKREQFAEVYAGYTRDDLIKDLRLIKKQMKVVLLTCYGKL